MNEWRNERTNERTNERMNEESWMRGQQTCPLTIHFNMWTVSSDVSIQRCHWQPLSVHLWAYCSHVKMYCKRARLLSSHPRLFILSFSGAAWARWLNVIAIWEPTRFLGSVTKICSLEIISTGNHCRRTCRSSNNKSGIAKSRINYHLNCVYFI